MTRFDPDFLPGSTFKYALLTSASSIALLAQAIPFGGPDAYGDDAFGVSDSWGFGSDHGIVVQDTRTATDGNRETSTFFGATGDAVYLADDVGDRRFATFDPQGDA